jgi:SAM-dependent methyltransferase
MDREATTRQWYEVQYGRTGSNRNDLRTNRGVLWQCLAMDASVIRAMYAVDHAPETATVLDVGCGAAGSMGLLIRLRYDPKNVTGIDIRSDRINAARELYSQATFVHGDASAMEFPDGSFDLVYESTMFATLPDEDLSAAIAREMVRVCRPGGYLLLVDWRTPRPTNRDYRALTRSRLKRLFSVGSETRLLGVFGGALLPPVGRLLSRFLPCAYLPLSVLCPLLIGQVVYLLRKTVTPS